MGDKKLAEAFTASGNIDDAIGVLSHGLEIFMICSGISLVRWLKKRDIDGATAILKKALMSHPIAPEFLDICALGDVDGPIDVLKRHFIKHPGDDSK